jgi:coproporphyrinogen III oxidase-like Fe-S oxidoreductase
MYEKLVGYFPGPRPNPGVIPLNGIATLAQLKKEWQSFLDNSPFAAEIGLYVHFPYCGQRCSYCDCSSQVLPVQVNLDDVLDQLCSEMDYMADVFKGVLLNRLYVGGGTPNLLKASQLTRLAQEIHARFSFQDGVIKCIEFAPEYTTDENIAAVKDQGFNRISFGVQSLDNEVLTAVDRAGMNKEVARAALDRAKQADLQEINLDLIYVLKDESDDSFHQGLMTLLSWGPDTVTFKLLHNSRLARVYRSAEHEREIAARYVNYVQEKLTKISGENDQYDLFQRPCASVVFKKSLGRPLDQWLDFYSSQDRVIVSTLGIGLHSHSRLHGQLLYQNRRRSNTFSSDSACYATQLLSHELEAAVDVACDLMNFGQADLEVVEARYKELPQSLDVEINKLVKAGKLKRAGDTVSCQPAQENPVLPLIKRLAEKLEETGLPDPDSCLTVRFNLEGNAWYIRIEKFEPQSSYYSVIDNRIGIYYGSKKQPIAAHEEKVQEIMNALDRFLRAQDLRDDNLVKLASQIKSLVISLVGHGF